jgi:hypothetical protein
LNGCFVPVYARNADYAAANDDPASGPLAAGGSAPADEKAEYLRIYREALDKGLSTGTVHVYVVSPDGHPLDSRHVADAAKPDRLIAMLERTVERLALEPGEPVVAPAARHRAPDAPADALVLHLVARYVERTPEGLAALVPELGQERSGQWGSLPSEEWLVLDRAAWSKLAPPDGATVGQSWACDAEAVEPLLLRFYPPSENTDVAKNTIEESELTGTVLSRDGDVVRARLDGRLRMRHPFYHRDTDERVEATLVGLVEWDAAAGRFRSFRLVTDEANYRLSADSAQPFGVAVRAVERDD